MVAFGTGRGMLMLQLLKTFVELLMHALVGVVLLLLTPGLATGQRSATGCRVHGGLSEGRCLFHKINSLVLGTHTTCLSADFFLLPFFFLCIRTEPADRREGKQD